MKIVIAILALAASALAQSVTGPRLGQVIYQGTGQGVVVWIPGLGLTVATLDPSVQIATATGQAPVIKATGGAAGSTTTKVRNEVYSPTSTQASFTIAHAPAAGSLTAYRNGIRMAPGVDYSLSGAVVTFVAAQAALAGDVILFDYEF